MKMKSTCENVASCSVWREDKVLLAFSPEEARKVKDALKIVDSLKEKAVELYKRQNGHHPEDKKDHSSFCAFNYSIKGTEVTVTIRNGMVG